MRIYWLLLALVSVGGGGCQSGPQRSDSALWRTSRDGQATQVDGERIRVDLYRFADEAVAELTDVAITIARDVSDTRTRELMLTWRLRSASALNAVVLDPDPRRALINTWVLITQQRQFVMDGGAAELLADEAHADLATQLMLALDERLERVIRSYVPEEVFADADAEIDQLARTNPIAIRTGAARLTLGSVNQMPAGGGIGDILVLPLAPLTGLQGVSSTAEAIDRIAVVLSVITEIVEDIPQRVRWQTEALILEIEAGRSMTDLRQAIARADEHVVQTEEHVSRLVEEVERAIDVTEALLPEVDRQREATLQAISTEREQILAGLDEQRLRLGETLGAERAAILDAVDQQRAAMMADLAGERATVVDDAQTVSRAVIDHAFRRALQVLAAAFIGVVVIVVIARIRFRRG
jgi:hypothetical protein